MVQSKYTAIQTSTRNNNMIQLVRTDPIKDRQKEKQERKEKKERKEQKEQMALAKQTINIIRTTQRNNIDLTAIADNKANVLLSLNAIMLTFIIPLILTNSDQIMEKHLYIPLIILSVTCFITMYLAAQVLKPSDFDQQRASTHPSIKASPFFFGNFYKMEAGEYYQFLQEGLAEENLVKAHLAQDMYYIGRRLGVKMDCIRKAFNIFIVGVFITLASSGIFLFMF